MIPVPNLDLMKKGLRQRKTLIFTSPSLSNSVPNLDLMKKGLRQNSFLTITITAKIILFQT